MRIFNCLFKSLVTATHHIVCVRKTPFEALMRRSRVNPTNLKTHTHNREREHPPAHPTLGHPWLDPDSKQP